jgi:integrase
MLVRRGSDLFNPESVKATIMSHSTWSNSTKSQVIAAYKKFAVLNNISWTPPKCEVVRKLPYIPLEKDIDELIACCGKKLSTVLQLLKETGMRIGEALRLDWDDVDSEQRTIVLNNPEKHGTPRMFSMSEKLIAMMGRLPRDNNRVFGNSSWRIMFNNFNAQRKHAAKKLGNPRLLKIHFHTFRIWKATMEYHRTKDILYVMKLLGHKNIANTLIYTQLVEFEENDKYCTAVARNIEDAQELMSVGFEYVCTYGDVMLFRKRK